MRPAREILADVKRLAVEYYRATGRPLGVTGEIAEHEAITKLGLELAPPRTPGYDALRNVGGRVERLQIKGRRTTQRSARVGAIDLTQDFDAVLLVLLDESFAASEIWEAPRSAVEARLRAPGGKARTERGSLGISQFRSIAKRVWP